MKLAKAKISKANDVGPLNEEMFHVPFNPNQITIEEACKSYGFQAKSHTAHDTEANKMFTTLSTTLYFNTFRSLNQPLFDSVDVQINQLRCFLNKHDTPYEKVKKIAFRWGDLSVFGVLESMQVKYTVFAPNGTAIRAEVNISIKGEHFAQQFTTKVDQAEEFILDSTSITALSIMRGQESPAAWKDMARSLGLINPFL